MIPDKDLTDDVLDEIIAGAKTSMEQYLALSLKAEREVWRKEGPTDDERIMAIEGIHYCERCGDEGWVVGEMGITRCACGQPGNSPIIPDGYVMVPKEPTKKMLIRAVATMSGCAPSLVDESDEELDDIREAYLDMLKVAPQLTIVANSDESQGVKDDVNKIINILKNGDWSDTHGYRGLKTEAGLALESEIEKIVALIEPSPTLAIDAIDAHLRKVLQETKGAQLLRKVVGHNWIPVSERMPVEFEAVIAFDGDQVYGEAMYSSDLGFTVDGYDPCDRMQLQNVTHWMPMPAAPQEVK